MGPKKKHHHQQTHTKRPNEEADHQEGGIHRIPALVKGGGELGGHTLVLNLKLSTLLVWVLLWAYVLWVY
jgi:hypothetical protein